MASSIPGISTLGITLGYAVETTAGTQPTSYTTLNRINAIGGISLESETIDASALEDEVQKTVAGRESGAENVSITVNATKDTISEWTTLISAYKTAAASSLSTWFQITVPNLGTFDLVGEPPRVIPMPEMSQNSLLTIEMPIVINDYKGFTAAK